jgi:DNA mismatch repair protein MutS
MGARLLKNYLLNPLKNKEEIKRRHDIVDSLLKEFILKGELEELLCSVYDLERLSGKVAFGNVNARDMLQLKTSISVFPEINKILKSLNLEVFDDLK